MDDLRNSLRQAYDQKTVERDTRPMPSWKAEERSRFLAALEQVNVRSLLEVGGNTGQDSLFFQQHGLDVTSIDLSPEAVAMAQQKGLNAQVMDITQLTFPNASFDAVYSFNCLLHLPKAEWPTALAQIQRVLKPNGLFYLGVYGGRDREGVYEGDSYEPKRFFAFFEDDALQSLLADFFEIVDFRPFRPPGQDEALHFQASLLHKKDSNS